MNTIYLLLIWLLSCAVSSKAIANELNSLSYLKEISGLRTITGQHNREPNWDPNRWSNWILETTGKTPGLWGGDFLYDSESSSPGNRWSMIWQAEQQWRKGALVSLMWHACNPALQRPCTWEPGNGPRSELSELQWHEILTEGSSLNAEWKTMMDEISIYLSYLADNGVEVLFRPFHEMNQGEFWWAGSQHTPALYRLTHNYLTNEKNFNNLIWVWDMQDFPSLKQDLITYNPGSNYWDIAALDVYDSSGLALWKYQAMQNISQGKPIALGELARLPAKEILANQPDWTFFMGWAELVQSSNTLQEIIDVYGASETITLEDKQKWIEYPENLALGKTVEVSSTEEGENKADRITDGQGTTRWSSHYLDHQWLIVDLGESYSFNHIKIFWRRLLLNPIVLRFPLISNNGKPFTLPQLHLVVSKILEI